MKESDYLRSVIKKLFELIPKYKKQKAKRILEGIDFLSADVDLRKKVNSNYIPISNHQLILLNYILLEKLKEKGSYRELTELLSVNKSRAHQIVHHLSRILNYYSKGVA